MNVSDYKLETLRRDAEFVLYRGLGVCGLTSAFRDINIAKAAGKVRAVPVLSPRLWSFCA